MSEQQPEQLSVEQMVRNIIEKCVEEGIVTFNSHNYGSTPTIQHMTSGDIVGPANLLNDYFSDYHKMISDRWQKAVGHSLETAEESAKGEAEEFKKFNKG
jgi:hypothetical protein